MSSAYSSLGQGGDHQEEDDLFLPGGQSFPLQDQTDHRHQSSRATSVSTDTIAQNQHRHHDRLRGLNYNHNDDDKDDDKDSESGSDLYMQQPDRDFRVTFKDDPIRTSHGDDEDEDDNDDDIDDLDDFAPLASTKRSYIHPSSVGGKGLGSNLSHPCRIFATVFGTAMVVSLAFALLSLLHLNSNDSLDSNKDSKTETGPDNRFLKPPAGISVDDFKLSDFQLPPWDWDINTFVPIDVTNGPKFTTIHWRNGEQYLSVDCPGQANYRYHFPSFTKNEFKEYTTATHGIEDLLPLGEESYVFVLCPPGKNNANLVFREFDIPDEDEDIPASPPHVDGTKEAPQPLLDDVVMILVDAISRAKFTIEMKTVMETLRTINTTTTGEGGGHRIFDFEHYNVLGQNSPPNKAFIYSGQSIENMNHGPKHWVWDVYEEQGFKTAHTDGECGGEKGNRDYTTGAITSEYSRLQGKIPAEYQMPQQAWCENHDMHVVADVWGQSCILPPQVDYDSTLMGGMRWNTPYCAGRMAIHEHIMENLEGWLGSTKGSRRFATYSFMDAHSPDHHHISFDKRFSDFLKNLLIGQDGRPPLLSPNSALVIMADHGLHYGRETYTFPGFIHHKIPPLFVALPNQFLQDRPHFLEALEQNQNRILSHLDLHQTFMHLAYGDMPMDGQDTEGNEYAKFMTDFIADGTFRYRFHPQAPNQTSYAQTYGRSLLLPMPEDRSCHTAGIPHDYCAFQPFLDLDPGKKVDAVFLRGALVLLAQRMNNLTKIHRVDDVCMQSSLTLEVDKGLASSEGKTMLEEASVTGSFDDIGTEDLVMESAYASAAPASFHPPSVSRPSGTGLGGKEREESRVFYFMVRDRHRPSRKYSVTMREDEVVLGIGNSITIQQMSAYSSAWQPCAKRISQGGKALGKWQDVVKHFCVCSPPPAQVVV